MIRGSEFCPATARKGEGASHVPREYKDDASYCVFCDNRIVRETRTFKGLSGGTFAKVYWCTRPLITEWP